MYTLRYVSGPSYSNDPHGCALYWNIEWLNQNLKCWVRISKFIHNKITCFIFHYHHVPLSHGSTVLVKGKFLWPKSLMEEEPFVFVLAERAPTYEMDPQAPIHGIKHFWCKMNFFSWHIWNEFWLIQCFLPFLFYWAWSRLLWFDVIHSYFFCWRIVDLHWG